MATYSTAEMTSALRITRLERRRRSRIESHVGEEDDGSTLHQAGPAKVSAYAGIGWDIRVPVGRVHVLQSGKHDDDDDADLERHHDRVGMGRPVNAHVQEPRHRGDDEYRRHVDNGTRGNEVLVRVHAEWGIDQCRRQMDVRVRKQAHDVSRPTHRDG
jgi:hypothetical protein